MRDNFLIVVKFSEFFFVLIGVVVYVIFICIWKKVFGEVLIIIN